MDTVDRRVLLAGLGLAGGSLLAKVAAAGDLNPPPGPIGPTMKRLDEVEPRTSVQSLAGSGSALYVIGQPGSYYLTGDVIGEAGKGGIEIASDDVTLDLCGFGVWGTLYTGSGIVSSSAHVRLVVYNGRVAGWRNHGVDLGQCEQCVIEGVQVAQLAHNGIQAGASSVVRSCTARECTDVGILVGAKGRIKDCLAVDCGTGMRADTGSLVRDCAVAGGGSFGFDLVGSGQHASGCTANACATGLACDANASLTGISTVACTSSGLHVRGSGNTVRECQAVGSPTGFQVTGTANLLVRNTAGGNTQNYSIAAGNAYGPLVNVAGAGDITARTNANHPWANFAY